MENSIATMLTGLPSPPLLRLGPCGVFVFLFLANYIMGVAKMMGLRSMIGTYNLK
jgi:hypothetical protein